MSYVTHTEVLEAIDHILGRKSRGPARYVIRMEVAKAHFMLFHSKGVDSDEYKALAPHFETCFNYMEQPALFESKQASLDKRK